MDGFFEKYGWTCAQLISGLITLGLIGGIMNNVNITQSQTMSQLHQSSTNSQVEYEIPLVEEGDFVVDNAIIDVNSQFNWKDYVHVQSSNALDLIDYIVVKGEVKTSIPGAYRLEFHLNWNGKNIVKTATYYVRE